jgi:hypothetical protein
MQQYRRKEQTTVIAIRLDLETEGLTYQKWGGTQRAKRGDWLVNNQDDVYTVDAETFDRTYHQVGRGLYEKKSKVWVKRAGEAGTIKTKEGSTAYEPGDYLVFNEPDGKDGYAIKPDKFDSLYEPV